MEKEELLSGGGCIQCFFLYYGKLVGAEAPYDKHWPLHASSLKSKLSGLAFFSSSLTWFVRAQSLKLRVLSQPSYEAYLCQ